MPPSCPGALSGGCATAQRTSRNSATTGILRKTISQMNVQMSTRLDRIPDAASVQPRIPPAGFITTRAFPQPLSCSAAPLNCVIACSSWMRATISLPVRRSMRSVPNSSTLNDASTVA
jgi:hypothetical protein